MIGQVGASPIKLNRATLLFFLSCFLCYCALSCSDLSGGYAVFLLYFPATMQWLDRGILSLWNRWHSLPSGNKIKLRYSLPVPFTIREQESNMSNRSIISTDKAPAAIGTYSQAVRVGQTVYLSGQIPLDPATMEMVTDSFEAQAVRVFENLKAVAEAAGGSLADFAKVTILLSDLDYFAQVNEVMARYFSEPYPARAAYAVKALPKGADIEVEAIMVVRG